MRCTQCSGTIPYDTDIGISAPCMFCEGTQMLGASDILANPELGVVKEQRQSQVLMTQLIEEALVNKKHTVIEAGTGVGKSFAYLLPHILSGKRTVVATTKKALQRQLLEKDLPYLKKHLQVLKSDKAGFNYSAIFGKGNYICYEAVKKKVKPKILEKWERHFFDLSPHGIDTDVPAALKVANDIRVDHCKGAKCPSATTCGYMQAKKEAREADILVTNHSYLGADLAFRIAQRNPIIADYQALVIDEAHALDDEMRGAFTLKVNKNSVSRLVKAYDAHLDLTGGEQYFTDLDILEQNWDALFNAITKQGKTFALTEAQCLPIIDNLNPAAVLAAMHANGEMSNDYSDHAITVRDLANDIVTTLKSAVYHGDDNRLTHLTYEKGHPEIHVTPIKMRGFIQRLTREAPTSFVSATLAVGGSLASIIDRYGIEAPLANQLGSPFDMRQQARLYIPEKMLSPVQKSSNPDGYEAYIAGLAAEIDTLITASQGHAFALFSARQEMEDVYDLLATKHTLCMQQADAATALRNFYTSPKATLFGLKTFWEGVDIPGDKLSLVIVVKLPFPHPMDPVVDARYRAEGGKKGGWERVFFVSMITDMRQGVGRLIRSKSDRGVVAILDPRILKPYGARVVKALGIPVIRSQDRIVANLKTLSAGYV